MRWMDRALRDWRMRKAEPWVRAGDRVLDIGSYDGAFLKKVASRIDRGVGVDPVAEPIKDGKIEVVRGSIPGIALEKGAFDCITMLAVLEHIHGREELARECAGLLSPGGRVVITVPRPVVDKILAVLKAVRLIDGMSLEEHEGYDVERTRAIFEGAGLRLVRRAGFQLGLNCLFVFEKPGESRG